MVPRHRLSISTSLAVLALLLLPLIGSSCPMYPVYLLLGYSEVAAPVDAVMSKDVPVVCPGVPAESLNLGDHRASAAPDGSTYIADWLHNVVLKLSDECGAETAIRVAGCNPDQVPPEPGSYQATTLPAPGIDVALDGPWGIDIAADGTVYIAENGYAAYAPEYGDVGRILRLDSDGTLSSVADVTKPSQVKVGRNGKLYVSAKNLFRTGGLHEVDIASGTVTEITSDFDSEGIALYENVATHESLLYAAAQIRKYPEETGNPWHDAYLCVIDLQDPGPCEVILRPENYAGGEPLVGPALDLLFDPPTSRNSRISDVETDDAGWLYFSYSLYNPMHCWNCGTQEWGGNAAQMYQWNPGNSYVTRVWGYPMDWVSFYNAYHPCQEAIADGTDGPAAHTYWASSTSMSAAGHPLLSDRECGFSGLVEKSPYEINYRTYEIRGIATGERLFLGADVATFALESLSEPPTTDPYLAENVVITGVASFVTDPQTQVLQSVQIAGTYPGVQGGTAYVTVNMTRDGESLVGNLMVADWSVGFTHYHGAADVVVSSESVSGNDIELEMESEDVGGGKGLFAVDIKLRDGY